METSKIIDALYNSDEQQLYILLGPDWMYKVGMLLWQMEDEIGNWENIALERG